MTYKLIVPTTHSVMLSIVHKNIWCSSEYLEQNWLEIHSMNVHPPFQVQVW